LQWLATGGFVLRRAGCRMRQAITPRRIEATMPSVDDESWEEFKKKLHEIKDGNVESWEEFEVRLRKIENLNKEWARPIYHLLFRGQEDAAWRLSTTLERNKPGKTSLEDYNDVIMRARPQIETFTEKHWDLPEPSEFGKWQDESGRVMPYPIPVYEDMAHLRHNGFPSPLLDWSQSPYIAAYFAFRKRPDPEIKACGKVSIYVYWEQLGSKFSASDKPDIRSLGPSIRTHRRHFLQQCEYTICMVRDGGPQYVSHEDAFARRDDEQDLLWKFNIPSTERLNVLRLLDRYNLNSLSLFGSEESLMETMALRELDFKQRNLGYPVE
jgi:FRG domain